ncbi:MAG: hypothetical protein J6T31_05910 [Methanobrevibacter sp.]|nr:hypothetical protein [Methanobrevibacter sp.]
MTKEELSKKRNRAIESLNDVGAILGLDEMYIDELEQENTELKEKAKELLNGCIFKARGNVNPSWSELITDIEQFLREIEK